MASQQNPSSSRHQTRIGIQQRPDDLNGRATATHQAGTNDAGPSERDLSAPTLLRQIPHSNTISERPWPPFMAETGEPNFRVRTDPIDENDGIFAGESFQQRSMQRPTNSSHGGLYQAQIPHRSVDGSHEATRQDRPGELTTTSHLSFVGYADAVPEQPLRSQVAQPNTQSEHSSRNEAWVFVNGCPGGGPYAHNAGLVNAPSDLRDFGPARAQVPEQSQRDQFEAEPTDESIDLFKGMNMTSYSPDSEISRMSQEYCRNLEYVQRDYQADDQECSNPYSYSQEGAECLGDGSELVDYPSYASGTSDPSGHTESSFGVLDSVSSQHSYDSPDWGEDSQATLRADRNLNPEPLYKCLTGFDNASHGGPATRFQLNVPQGTPLNDDFKQSGHCQSWRGSGQHDDLTQPMSLQAPGLSPSSPASSLSDVLYCEICSTRFTGAYGKGNLSRHTRLLHAREAKTFPCEDDNCERVFARSDARKKHYRKHHLHLVDGPAIVFYNDEERHRQMSQDLRNVWNGGAN